MGWRTDKNHQRRQLHREGQYHVIVRSNQFGVRRLKTRRGGPLRPPVKGAHGEVSLRYLFNKDSKEKEEMIKYSAFRNPQFAIGNKGFTLIEIIILIVMAGILLPVIIVPFVAGVKASGKPEMVNTAMYLGHQKMEEFMKYRYLNSALNPTAITSYANIPGFSGYQWQWEIYYVDSNFLNPDLATHRGYKRILVRVKDPMNDTYEICSVVTFFP